MESNWYPQHTVIMVHWDTNYCLCLHQTHQDFKTQWTTICLWNSRGKSYFNIHVISLDQKLLFTVILCRSRFSQKLDSNFLWKNDTCFSSVHTNIWMFAWNINWPLYLLSGVCLASCWWTFVWRFWKLSVWSWWTWIESLSISYFATFPFCNFCPPFAIFLLQVQVTELLLLSFRQNSALFNVISRSPFQLPSDFFPFLQNISSTTLFLLFFETLF